MNDKDMSIDNVANTFYNKWMDELETFGTFDTEDEGTKMFEEILAMLGEILDRKTLNKLEDMIFAYGDYEVKTHYIRGFKDGASVMRAMLSEEH